jgi:hypothetical protein
MLALCTGAIGDVPIQVSQERVPGRNCSRLYLSVSADTDPSAATATIYTNPVSCGGRSLSLTRA